VCGGRQLKTGFLGKTTRLDIATFLYQSLKAGIGKLKGVQSLTKGNETWHLTSSI